jgi:ribonuclease HII
MARTSAKSADKGKASGRKKAVDPIDLLSERLAFDCDRFDEFVVGKSDLTVFRKPARVNNENCGQLRLFSETRRLVIGVDEVGRGCLAGPVVAAAVLLPWFDRNSELAESLAALDDSKKLPVATREELSRIIRGCASFAIAEASPEEIDEINILHASLLAMKRAVTQLVSQAMLDLKECLILVDGKWKMADIECNQLPVIKGDSHSAAIAAASVIAKVHRDALMCELADAFPQYHWLSNKGYPSELHRRAIQEHGMTVWHRRSFRCLPGNDDFLVDEMGDRKELAMVGANPSPARGSGKGSSKRKGGTAKRKAGSSSASASAKAGAKSASSKRSKKNS